MFPRNQFGVLFKMNEIKKKLELSLLGAVETPLDFTHQIFKIRPYGAITYDIFHLGLIKMPTSY